MGVIRTLLTVLQDASDDGDGAQATEREATPAEPDTYLTHCPACETTYVTLALETCPDCGQPLAEIATERELGMT